MPKNLLHIYDTFSVSKDYVTVPEKGFSLLLFTYKFKSQFIHAIKSENFSKES